MSTSLLTNQLRAKHAGLLIAALVTFLAMGPQSAESDSPNSNPNLSDHAGDASQKARYCFNQAIARVEPATSNRVKDRIVSSDDPAFSGGVLRVRFDDRGPTESGPQNHHGGTPVRPTTVTVTSPVSDREEQESVPPTGTTPVATGTGNSTHDEHYGPPTPPPRFFTLLVIALIFVIALIIISRTLRDERSQEQPRHPDKGYNPPLYPLRIAIKFKTDSGKPNQLDGWQASLGRRAKDLAPLRAWPLFGSLNSKLLGELVNLAQKNDAHYKPVNWSAWVQVETPAGVNADELVKPLRKLANVETAYVMVPSPPPVSVDKLSQHYQEAAPDGIDVRHAWGFEGGNGAGIGFVDLEQGWNLDHEDLKDAKITLISGVNRMAHSHGTSVLGEVLMADNNKGGVGIAPSAQGRVISLWRTDAGSKNDGSATDAEVINDGRPVYHTALAIADAAAKMSPGDVLLIEVQERDPAGGTYDWPAEILLANYEQICTAISKGIIVVEAAGNGAHDLDSYKNENGEKIFDRSFRDSGAIIVGAGSSRHPHTKCPKSNHGKRIDCYAWGMNVDTTTTDEKSKNNTMYTTVFGGTSGASPIVAGAALVLQGIAQAAINRRERDHRFNPRELRDLLKTNGTKLDDGSTESIGVMPNLRAIIADNERDLKAIPIPNVEPP